MGNEAEISIEEREDKYLTERFSLLIVDMNWRLTIMNELDKLLVEVDKIEDDDKWLEAEHDTVQQYCEDKNYEMTEDEMETIRSRGLEESFESWIEFKEMMEEWLWRSIVWHLQHMKNMK